MSDEEGKDPHPQTILCSPTPMCSSASRFTYRSTNIPGAEMKNQKPSLNPSPHPFKPIPAANPVPLPPENIPVLLLAVDTDPLLE